MSNILPANGAQPSNGCPKKRDQHDDGSINNIRLTSLSISSSNKSNNKVIIVGAGIAGLAAAQKLHQHGYQDVTILEAQARAGGRIWTEFLDEGCIELGAQWIHGEQGNPLHSFALGRNLLSDPKIDYGIEGEGQFCTERGDKLNQIDVDEAIMCMDRAYEKLSKGTYDCLTQTVDEVFRRHFEVYVNGNLKTSPEVLWAIFDWYLLFESIDNACDDLAKMSTKAYSDWIECPGVPLINFQKGFSSIIESMIEEIGINSIRLNSPVKRIVYSDDVPFVQVHTDEEVITAHHVIVTPSIGVLKETMDSWFKPPLPEIKAKIIRNTGFGTINKIYLEFKTPFWSKLDFGFQLVWLNKNKLLLPSWAYYISGFDVVKGHNNMLVGWIGGKGAKIVEKEDTAAISRVCITILRTFLKNELIPEPVRVICSKWFSNEYVRGSYSHRSIDEDQLQLPIEVLQEPLFKRLNENTQWPCILFAGEATDKEFYSSTHGGLRSGWREAERLIKFWATVPNSV